MSFVYNTKIKCEENYTNIGDIKTSILIIDMHGETIPSLFRLPNNVNIVFLSPISYLTCCRTTYVIDDILEQINAYNADNKSNNFFTNPICFNKEKHGDTFSQSVLYLGGQYCPDLSLSRYADTVDKKENVTGMHYYDKVNNKIENISETTKQTNFSMPLKIKKLPDWTKGSEKIVLSRFLENTKYFINPNTKFTIFLTSCRSINDITHKDILVLSERITTAINFKISLDNAPSKTNNTNTNGDLMVEKYNNCFSKATHFTSNKRTMYTVQSRIPTDNANRARLRSGLQINIREDSPYTFLLDKQIADIPDTYLKELIKYNIIQLANDTYNTTFKNLRNCFYHSNYNNKNNFFLLLYLLLFNECQASVRKQINNNKFYQDYCFDDFINKLEFIFDSSIHVILNFIIFYLLKSNDKHKYVPMFITKVIDTFVKKYQSSYRLSTINVLNLSDLIIPSYSLLDTLLPYLTSKHIIITELRLDNIDFSDNMNNLKVIIYTCVRGKTIKKITLQCSFYLQYSINYCGVLNLYYNELHSNIWDRNESIFNEKTEDEAYESISYKCGLYIENIDYVPFEYRELINNIEQKCNSEIKTYNYVSLENVRKLVEDTHIFFVFVTTLLYYNISSLHNSLKTSELIFKDKQLLFKYIIFVLLFEEKHDKEVILQSITDFMSKNSGFKLDNNILDLSNVILYKDIWVFILNLLINIKLEIIGINLNNADITYLNFTADLRTILEHKNIEIISIEQSDPRCIRLSTKLTLKHAKFFTDTTKDSFIWIRNSIDDEKRKIELLLIPFKNKHQYTSM